MSKVIFVNRFFAPDESATSRILSDLAFGLVKRGWQVVVITSRQRLEEPDAQLPNRETLNGVEVLRVATTRFGRLNLIGRIVDYLSFYVSASWNLFLLSRRGDIVIPKTDPPIFSVPARLCCTIRGAHQVNWLQDVFPEVAIRLGVAKTPLKIIGGVLLSLRNWSLRQSSMNVVIGDRMRRHLISEGVQANRIALIPNWTDTTNIVPIPSKENPLRADWDLGDAFVVGYSGNLGRAHRYDAVLAACRHFRTDTRIKFLFIGGGMGMTQLKSITEAEGLRNVIFKPYQPRDTLALSLSLPDIHIVTLEPQLEGLVVPSKYYGVAAAGRAAVYLGAVDGEIADLLSKNQSGVAIRVDDGQSLIKFLCDSLEHGLQRVYLMGDRARAQASSEFSCEVGIQRWDSQLRTILRAQGQRATGSSS